MSWRWRFVSLLALALVGLAVAAGVQRFASRPYNVIFLTVESWRADAVRPEVMPELLAAAGQGLWFKNHRCVSAWTIPNIVALLTGVSPFDQGIHSRADALAPDPGLPLAVMAREHREVAGLQAFMQIEGFSNLGLTIEQGGEELMPWLARRVLDRRPFAVWYHYLDTHLPYAPMPEFRPDWEALLPGGGPTGTGQGGEPDASAAARARVEIVMRQPVVPAGSVDFQPGDAPAIAALHTGSYRQFDHWFGRLREFLTESGLAADTIVVLTADHGDEHLEHGNVGHASTTHAGHLHDEVMRVPLFVWLPSRHPDAGRARGVESAPTDHLMVMPTVARLVRGGFDRPGGLLAPEPSRPWMALTSRGGYSEPDPDHAATYVGARIERDHKLMLTLEGGQVAARAYYDLGADPAELHPLPATPHAFARMEPVLLAAMHAMAGPHKALRSGPGGTAGGAGEGAGADGGRTTAAPPLAEPPRWLWPGQDGALSHTALDGRFQLRWTGSDQEHYLIEYQAGEGAMQFTGTLEVAGTTKDFGQVSAAYWRTFVVPYGRVRMRVGRGLVWSPWREVRLEP